jgi:transposase-like protein
MYRNDKVIRRYSEPFKLKILAELTTGEHTKSELCKLKKYNRKDLMNTRVNVETKN